MKRFVSIVSLVLISQLFAAPGCMDNSYHLTKMFDHKNYHYVACNCPCEGHYKILSDRAQCSKCLHYRDPKYTNMFTDDTNVMPLCLVRPYATPKPMLIGYPKELLQHM